jgi:hypothetical protein
MGRILKTTDCILFTTAHVVKTALIGLQRRPKVTPMNSYASLHTKRLSQRCQLCTNMDDTTYNNSCVNSVRNKDI